jgi:signal transduction histidine kinase
MAALQHSLADLAAHLRARRAETLKSWREAVMADRVLTTAHSLPRNQLDDHVPGLLQAYELRLNPGATAAETAVAEQGQQAVAHGLHRWQQGYDLQEVSRELGHLNAAVVVQLEKYARERPELESEVMATARWIWAEMSGTESSKSIAEYFRLRQVEAAGHVKDLEQALEKIRELEQERANLWQQAAHDLRGNLVVVMTATAGLNRAGAAQPAQERFLRVLDRNVASLHHLLNDVMDLARLHAGRETRRVAEFDVAASLTELVDGLLGFAEQRNLFLRRDGPAPFVVEGDAVKVRRLVQNLVINAIKYTKQGGVIVSWGNSASDDAKRWMVSIQDTGPGFAAGPGTPLVGALEQATEAAEQATGEEGGTRPPSGSQAAPALAGPGFVNQEHGEGIGLSIVKRLAELLDATVEVQSDSTGTTFRVLLPLRYVG